MSAQKQAVVNAHVRVPATDPARLGKYDNLISYTTTDGKKGRIRIAKDPVSDVDIQQAIQTDISNFKSSVGKKFNYV
jgi:hypothetical protein